MDTRNKDKKDIRSFIALDIPPEAKQYLNSLIKARSHKIQGARWVQPEQMHFTMKFFPSFPLSLVPQMKDVLSQLSRVFSPFTIVLENMGAFPSLAKARVLWVGTNQASGQILGSIAENLEKSCKQLGFAGEKRPFVPHITLARFRSPRNLPANILHMDNSCETIVRTMCFYQSTLTPTGAIYHPLCEYHME